jgi:hypothetical protein
LEKTGIQHYGKRLENSMGRQANALLLTVPSRLGAFAFLREKTEKTGKTGTQHF